MKACSNVEYVRMRKGSVGVYFKTQPQYSAGETE
jgi:hypothetical protein